MCKTGGPRCQRHTNDRLAAAREHLAQVTAAAERGEATSAQVQRATETLERRLEQWDTTPEGIVSNTAAVADLEPGTPEYDVALARARAGLAERIRQSQAVQEREGHKVHEGVFVPIGDDGRRVRVKAIQVASTADAQACRDFIAVHNSTPAGRTRPMATGVPPMYELDAASAHEFRANMVQARGGVYGAAVYVYPEGEYRSMRVLMTPDGQAGVAVKEDGDIVSVHSIKPSRWANLGQVVVSTSKTVGGDHLDCYDTVLPSIYARAGFQETNRMAWDEQYKPDGWDYGTFSTSKFPDGKPDVVEMERVM